MNDIPTRDTYTYDLVVRVTTMNDPHGAKFEIAKEQILSAISDRADFSDCLPSRVSVIDRSQIRQDETVILDDLPRPRT